MPFSYREEDRRCVEVFSAAQVPAIAFYQALKRGRIASRGGGNRLPDIPPAVELELSRFDDAPAQVGLESGPAMESVRPGEHKLSVMQGEFRGSAPGSRAAASETASGSPARTASSNCFA